MRQLVLVLSLMAAMALALGGAVRVQAAAPVGGCPDGFMLHAMDEMPEGEPQHRHVGTELDLNGDGYLCMKHVGRDGYNHVHVDNTVPCDPDPSRCVVGG